MDPTGLFFYSCIIGLPILVWFLAPNKLPKPLKAILVVLLVIAEAIGLYLGDVLTSSLIGWSSATALLGYRLMRPSRWRVLTSLTCSIAMALAARTLIFWPVHHKPRYAPVLNDVRRSTTPAEPDYLIHLSDLK